MFNCTFCYEFILMKASPTGALPPEMEDGEVCVDLRFWESPPSQNGALPPAQKSLPLLQADTGARDTE